MRQPDAEGGGEPRLPTVRGVRPTRFEGFTIVVTPEAVRVDETTFADTGDLERGALRRIDALYQAAVAARSRMSDDHAGFALVCDERVSFAAVASVLYSVIQAGLWLLDYVVRDESGTIGRLALSDDPSGSEPPPTRRFLHVLAGAAELWEVAADEPSDRGRRPIGRYEGATAEAEMLLELRRIRARAPTRRDIIVAPDRDVSYGRIIAAMNTLVSEGIDEISLADGAPF